MYRIFQGDDLIYAPNIKQYAVIDPVCTMEINQAGTLEFTLLPDNPMWDSIEFLTGTIFLYNDDELIWYGRPKSVNENLWGYRKITCEGALGFLNDVMWEPATYSYSWNYSVYAVAEIFINRYNDKKTTFGELNRIIHLMQDVNYPWETRTGERLFKWIDWQNGLLFLQSLLNDYGGYAKCEWNGTDTNLILSSDFGEIIDQPIEFGKNMMDLDRYLDTSAIYTAVVPLGERYKYAAGTSRRMQRPIQINSAGVARYGYIEKEFILEGYSSVSDIDAPASEFLQQGILGATTLDLKAIDLSLVTDNLDSFKIGVSIPVKSEKHGLDTTVMCSQCVLHLDAPENNEYTLGTPAQNYTTMMSEQFLEAQYTSNRLGHDITMLQS